MVEGAAMGLSIKNTDVERMAREAAKRRGVSMTEALRQLLAEEEARVAVAREAEIEAKVRALQEIIERTARLPRLSERSDDEIIGYDEHGLPR
jgi:antitoxin VapB